VPGKPFIHLTAVVSYLTPPFVTAIAFVNLFSPRAGLVNRLVRDVLSIPALTFDVFSMAGLILVTVPHTFPFVYLLAASARVGGRVHGGIGADPRRLRHYHFVLLEYDVTRRAIWNSLILASATATLGVLLGSLVGWIDLRTTLRGRKLLDYASLIPLGLPGIVVAVALIQFWLRVPLPIDGTLFDSQQSSVFG